MCQALQNHRTVLRPPNGQLEPGGSTLNPGNNPNTLTGLGVLLLGISCLAPRFLRGPQRTGCRFCKVAGNRLVRLTLLALHLIEVCLHDFSPYEMTSSSHRYRTECYKVGSHAHFECIEPRRHPSCAPTRGAGVTGRLKIGVS